MWRPLPGEGQWQQAAGRDPWAPQRAGRSVPETVQDPGLDGDDTKGAVGGVINSAQRRHPLPFGIHNRHFLPQGQSPGPPRRRPRPRSNRLDATLQNYLVFDPSLSPHRTQAAPRADGDGATASQDCCHQCRVEPATRGGQSYTIDEGRAENSCTGGHQEGERRENASLEEAGKGGGNVLDTERRACGCSDTTASVGGFHNSSAGQRFRACSAGNIDDSSSSNERHMTESEATVDSARGYIRHSSADSDSVSSSSSSDYSSSDDDSDSSSSSSSSSSIRWVCSSPEGLPYNRV